MFIVKGWSVACNINHDDREDCQGILVASIGQNPETGNPVEAHIFFYDKKDAMREAVNAGSNKVRAIELRVYEDSDKIENGQEN